MWLIDSQVFVASAREGNDCLSEWLLTAGDVVTSDVVRAELIVGCHAPKAAAARRWAAEHFAALVEPLPSLPVTQAVANRAGELAGTARRRGFQAKLTDALIAATAELSGRTVVTADLADFAALGVKAVNPWKTAK